MPNQYDGNNGNGYQPKTDPSKTPQPPTARDDLGETFELMTDALVADDRETIFAYCEVVGSAEQLSYNLRHALRFTDLQDVAREHLAIGMDHDQRLDRLLTIAAVRIKYNDR